MTDYMWGNIITDEIPNVHNILTYDSKKITEIGKNLKNEFWRDVLEAFAALSRACRPELAEMLYESI